ncbi:MAG: NAD-dependent epimerase/dehydratase family protein [Planctomycetes bacterium]|nr:NAD-dependent epimerase/dehydratase family protein [Planctomycetota bacterium]
MKALVTGGGGFLGYALISQLMEENWEITSIGRSRQEKNLARGINCVEGDICDPDLMVQLTQGVDSVFHVAALAGIWGKKEDYEKINIEGTLNIIRACQQSSVPRLIFTSSPSVCFKGTDQIMSNENESYPDSWLWHYPRTKAEAEKAILKANSETLKCTALRPHLIWGPGDPNLLPRVIAKASQGKLRIVGDGQNQVDMVYVDNAASAHVLAEKALREGKGAGEAYYITNDEPVFLWTWINELLERKGIPPIRKSISASAAFRVGQALEWIYGTFGLKGEPPMTRFVARQLSTHHTYDISKAKKDLGYSAKICMKEGLDIYLS